MAAVTALFMIPTALVFPALLRKANTPPSSVTLKRVQHYRRQRQDPRSLLGRMGRSKPEQGLLVSVEERDPRGKEEREGEN